MSISHILTITKSRCPELTDCTIGYGAICADNYGLYWGNTKLSTERIVWEQWVQERSLAGQWTWFPLTNPR